MLYGAEDILATLEYFGTPATIFIDTDNEIIITGMFDYANEEFVYEAKVSARNPVFVCREADVIDVKKEMKITINFVAYTIRDYKPDGTGVTVLELKK
jgi:hypothetical protein